MVAVRDVFLVDRRTHRERRFGTRFGIVEEPGEHERSTGAHHRFDDHPPDLADKRHHFVA